MSQPDAPASSSDADTGDRYSSYLEWKMWDEGQFGLSGAEEQAYFRKLVDLAAPLAGKDVCEVGFGNGALLSWLGATGHRVFGVELQKELVERANSRGMTAVADIASFPSDMRFDLILLIDVVEHIQQHAIPGFLTSMKVRLKPGGRIIARFPNGDSPFGLKNQNGDVTHVTTIGSKKLGYFARRAGLAVVYLGAEPLAVGGGSVTKQIKKALSIPLRWLLRKLLTTFLTLPMDKVFFSQNLVAVLENRSPSDSN